MRLSPSEVRALKRENARWPETLIEMPRTDWPQRLFADSDRRIAVFKSRKFLVQVMDDPHSTRLTISRTDWDERQQRWRDDVSWDDIQRLKAEAGFAESWAVEMFPADSEVINVANMRHIWLLDGPPAFAWRCEKREQAA